MYDPQEYKDLQADKPDTPKEPSPLVVSDTSEYVQEVDEYGIPIYCNMLDNQRCNLLAVVLPVTSGR